MSTEKPAFAQLERDIGVQAGFFERLVEEDDWSFVIKLHALFEAACAHLLLFHFREPALAEIVARLELSNKTTGKIAFLAALELVGKRSRRYIAALSELRNDLVHDVRNAEFKLQDWFASLDPAEQKTVAISFSPYETFIREAPLRPGLPPLDPRIQEQAKLENVLRRAREQTKGHIWHGAYSVLVDLSDMEGFSDYRQWLKAKAVMAMDDDEDADDDDAGANSEG
jgi:hypothetical protein